MHRFDIEKAIRIVIQFREDDSGVLCPQIGLENNYSVHSGSRAAAIVPEDDCVVTFLAAAAWGEVNSTCNNRGTAAISRACTARARHRRGNKSMYPGGD